MSDLGHAKTEKEIVKLEKRIREVYSQAERDILEKMDDFNRRYREKEAIHLQELKDGKITQEQFDSWKRGQVFQSEQWKAKRQQIADTLYTSNCVAMGIVNGNMANVFAINANYQNYQMEHDTGINFGFGMYDSATVARLLKDDPQLLPKRKVNAAKDKAWNKRNINNCVLQGIIQGESLDKIAERISKTTGERNRNTMLTAARTSMTSAQNAGRVHSLQHAKGLGINVVKEWMATLDARTRDSHAAIDGEQRPVGDKWHPMKFSNGCRYPGDPEAPAREVYNCRCTMVGDVTDYPAEYKRYDNIDGVPIENMTYKEWEKAKSGTIQTVHDSESAVNDVIRKSITPESASEDWFEYYNANVMREYIETGKMPTRYMDGSEVDAETRERLMAEAELIQNVGATTKTEYNTLYRGMVLDEDDARSMFTPGEYYTFNTLSATTTDRGIASIYTDPENIGGDVVPVIIEIQKPDGVYGFDRDGTEVVIPKGSEFRVVRNWMDENGVVHISLYAKKGKNVK